LRNCFKDFPQGTIHIISIDDELTNKNEHLVVKANDHYFISTDNGFFSLLLNEMKPEKIICLNISQSSNCMTFAIKNIFVPAACHLARGGTMEIIGSEVSDFKIKKSELNPVIEKDTIKGSIIYVDNYGNAITNISQKIFEDVQKERNFSILFGRENEQIIAISKKYKEVSPSEKLALFGENNFLQIAINQGQANKLLGLNQYEIIRIEFK